MKGLNTAMIMAVLSFPCVDVHGREVALAAEKTPAGSVTVHPDGRPAATLRMEATDQGVVLKYGDGPGWCDMLGAQFSISDMKAKSTSPAGPWVKQPEVVPFRTK